jgi:lipopolysaccharide export system permease protein
MLIVLAGVFFGRAEAAPKERIFCEPFGHVTFYINSFSSKEKIMKDIFLVDRREPSITHTIVAKEGTILSYPKMRMMMVHLIDGTIFVLEKNSETARTIKFSTYDLSIDLNDIMSGSSMRKRSPKEMRIGELHEYLKVTQVTPKGQGAYNEMAMELMERFSIPLAVFFMGIIGAPLGAQIRSGGRSVGIAISLIIFVAYYLCLVGVRSVGETGTLSPFVGMWLPVVFLVVSCLFLLRRDRNERPILFLEKVVAVFSR